MREASQTVAGNDELTDLDALAGQGVVEQLAAYPRALKPSARRSAASGVPCQNPLSAMQGGQ